jgi:hypothetical protein
MDEVSKVVFEYGKVLLKMDRSKSESAQLIRALGGPEHEQIRQQRIAKYWNQRSLWDRPDGLLVVTNHRVVFLTKLDTIATTTDFLSLPLELIEDPVPARVWFFVPAVRFSVQRVPFAFTFLNDAASTVRAIQQAKADADAERIVPLT